MNATCIRTSVLIFLKKSMGAIAINSLVILANDGDSLKGYSFCEIDPSP
jgi:hypothetical protein